MLQVKNQTLLLILLLVLGAFLRFYNLNWGAPFYLHPDERNIASAVSQLNFPNQMHPHFFAYGALPIYLTYFTGLIFNYFSSFLAVSPLSPDTLTIVSFSHAIIIGRAYSAILSTLLIPLLYLIGKRLKDANTGFLTAFVATFSVGFIQFAHFGTFEIWLTFFTTLLFLLCLQTIKNKKVSTVLFLGLTFGALVAIKISSLALLPIALVASIFRPSKKYRKILLMLLLFFLSSAFAFITTNPYALIDYPAFLSSMNYESGVVLNKPPVFYTGGFHNTIPVAFQLTNIFPFLINPLLTVIFIPAFGYIAFIALKKRVISYLLLVISFLLLFIPQAFLFAKWTRYMVPTLPFIYLTLSLALISLWNFVDKKKQVSSIKYLVLSIFLSSNILFGISYFLTAFARSDTRTVANEFANHTIPKTAEILSEPYDLGLTIFERDFTNISIFNFYELDQKSEEFTEQALRDKLLTTDYIILPSQRLLRNRLLYKKNFPKGNDFYEKLTSGELGFDKIYETPCDLLCKITYLGGSIYSIEETASVFDRPTVYIFKNTK